MTVEQVQKTAPWSYELRLNKSEVSGWTTGVIAKPLSDLTGDDSDMFASVGFCNGRLVMVTRSIDPDTEFPRSVEDWLRDFGQPKVNVRREPWTGTGGGEVVTVQFDWSHGGVKYILSLIPEGRSGARELEVGF